MSRLTDLAREAAERAEHTTERYAGVVLQHPPPALGGNAFWSSFGFSSPRSMADWFAEWVNDPAQYVYVAAFDKHDPAWTHGTAVAEHPMQIGPWIAGDPMSVHAIIGAARPHERSRQRFEHLRKLVAQHERYWAAVAQANPRSQAVRTFLSHAWDPYYRRYLEGSASEEAVNDLARELSRLRLEALASGIPLPDIGTASATSVGKHGGGGGGHHGHGGRRYFARRPQGGYDGWYDDDGGADVEVNVNLFDGDPAMNSNDPWRAMESSPPAAFPVMPGRAQFRGVPRARVGLLADVAPVLAPGTGGHTVAFDLDAKHQLRVLVIVDGHQYEATADLSGAIADAMRQVAQQGGARAAAAPGGTAVAGDALLGAIDDRVGAACEEMVGALLDQHMDVISAGWWHSITSTVSHAVSSAVHGVGDAASATGSAIKKTFKKLKEPIGIAAGVAAGAAAAAIPGVGPFVAPMAGSLAHSMVEAAAGDGDVKKAAQQAVAAATQAAQTDPNMAKALDVAHKAVAQTTAAYHIADTVASAAQGDKAALAQVQQLGSAAAQGDPAAQQAMDVAAAAAAAGPGIFDAFTSAISSGDPFDDELAQYRARAEQVTKHTFAQHHKARALGYLREGTRERTYLFGSTSDADRWFAELPVGYSYAALFGAHEGLLVDNLDASSGDQVAVGTGGPRVDIIGAALSTIRRQAADAAGMMPGRVIGIVRHTDGTWSMPTFASSDDADDWFGGATSEPGAFTYAAYYDKGDPSFPAPLNEAVGHGHAVAKHGPSIPRGIAEAA